VALPSCPETLSGSFRTNIFSPAKPSFQALEPPVCAFARIGFFTPETRKKQMSKHNTNARRSYEVGYGKPPKQHQFKRGRSGNPNGRPRGVKNIKAQITDELNRKVTITVNGRKREVSQLNSLILRLISDAHKGNVRANEILLRYCEKFGLLSETDKAIDVTREDFEILNAFRVTQANTVQEPENAETGDEDDDSYLN